MQTRRLDKPLHVCYNVYNKKPNSSMKVLCFRQPVAVRNLREIYKQREDLSPQSIGVSGVFFYVQKYREVNHILINKSEFCHLAAKPKKNGSK